MIYPCRVQTKDSTYNTYFKQSVVDALPVSIETVTRHLKLPSEPTGEELDYIKLLIIGAMETAEDYMSRSILTTTWLTYRERFTDIIELRRATFNSLTSFKYLVDDVLTTIDTNLYNLKLSFEFSQIRLKTDQQYPTDIDENPQAIEIEFLAGMGDDETEIPNKIKLALLNHIAYVYSNAGDCATAQELIADARSIPPTSRLIYEQNRIYSLC